MSECGRAALQQNKRGNRPLSRGNAWRFWYLNGIACGNLEIRKDIRFVHENMSLLRKEFNISSNLWFNSSRSTEEAGFEADLIMFPAFIAELFEYTHSPGIFFFFRSRCVLWRTSPFRNLPIEQIWFLPKSG
jgi:hypothetical protein